MKICLMTSNRPRHLHFAESLSKLASEMVLIQEAKPAKLYAPKSMSREWSDYIKRMDDAETEIFGRVRFTSIRCNSMVLGLDEISTLDIRDLLTLQGYDVFIVFGCGMIKGPIAEFLFSKKAINLHMGLSPYFRGSACNFWAQYLGYPELVGATIHYLSASVDGGHVISRVIPSHLTDDGFKNGMLAVLSGQKAIIDILKNGKLRQQVGRPQRSADLISITKRADLTETVMSDFMTKKKWMINGLDQKRKNRLLQMDPDLIYI